MTSRTRCTNVPSLGNDLRRLLGALLLVFGAGVVPGAGLACAQPGDVLLYPDRDLQVQIDAHRPGTSFVLTAGIYRQQTIRPREGDTFTGEPGAVLSGARELTSFTRVGDLWMADGQAQQGRVHGMCQAQYPRCSMPEQLFIDDIMLRHVSGVGEVGPGRWFFDYAADRIYMGDDPANRRVETSVTTTAIDATANNVTVRGLVVEKYANLAQFGAITAAGRVNWTIAGNEVRWNHGLGIRVGSGARVSGNNVHHNGQLGIGGGWGSGLDIVIERNEIAYNNMAHFEAAWEAGGTKFAGTTRLIVRENYVHHNGGPGLWTDIDNVNTLYDGNTSEDNERMGILHEISYAAVIRNNTVRRNGFGFKEWAWGAGILVAASPDVEIYGNHVEGNAGGIAAVQQKRGSGALGPYEVSNLWVHDNAVAMSQGWTGIFQDVGDTSYYTSRNNRFERNTYRLGLGAAYFSWLNVGRSESEWRSYGQDVAGSFSR